MHNRRESDSNEAIPKADSDSLLAKFSRIFGALMSPRDDGPNGASVRVEDPSFRAACVIEIDADEADVEPVEEGTLLGVDHALQPAFASFHRTWLEREENPEAKKQVIKAFMEGWEEDLEREGLKGASQSK
jgi:hypothetical protein